MSKVTFEIDPTTDSGALMVSAHAGRDWREVRDAVQSVGGENLEHAGDGFLYALVGGSWDDAKDSGLDEYAYDRYVDALIKEVKREIKDAGFPVKVL